MHAVIFDIDGTLLHSAAVDDALYREAVRQVLGDVQLRASIHAYDYVTNAGIFAQSLHRVREFEFHLALAGGASHRRCAHRVRRVDLGDLQVDLSLHGRVFGIRIVAGCRVGVGLIDRGDSRSVCLCALCSDGGQDG